MNFRFLWVVFALASATSHLMGGEGAPVFVAVVGQDTKSTVGELGRENDKHIEVIDLKTGQSQIFTKSDLRSISKDVTSADVIDRIGLPAFMAWRIKKVIPVGAANGKIVEIDGAVVYVSFGKDVGLEIGKELVVYRGAVEIKDPDTGAVLGKRRKRVAKLEAVEVEQKLTKAKLVGDLETTLQIGDAVEPAVVSNSIAVLPIVNPRGQETIGSKRIAEELITGLVDRDVSVVERRLLDDVLVELSLQQTVGFNEAKAQKIGKQLGAYAVVLGTVTPKNKYAEAQLRLVRVETGEIMIAATQTFREVGDLLEVSLEKDDPLIGVWLEEAQGKQLRRVIRTFESGGKLVIGGETIGTWRREGNRVYLPGGEKWFVIVEHDDTTMKILMMGQREYVWKKVRK